MANLTRKEFGMMFSVNTAFITTYIKRGKLVVNSDGKKIDTEDPINADFCKHYKPKTKSDPIPKQPAASVDVIPVELAASAKKRVAKIAEESTVGRYQLDLKKIEQEIEKKEVDTQIARMRLAVLQGDNVPISLVKQIISSFSKSFITGYKSFSEQLITDICHQNGIPELDRVRITGKLVTSLNDLHYKSVNDARVQLKNAVGETQIREANENDD